MYVPRIHRERKASQIDFLTAYLPELSRLIKSLKQVE